MSLQTSRTGIYVGREHGNIVTRPAMPWKTRPVTRKGKISKRSKAVREIIREISGLSPLEARMDELLRAGEQSKDKKAVKIARQKLGTHKRALHKKDQLNAMIALQRKR